MLDAPLTSTRPAIGPDREFGYTEADFLAIAGILRQAAGISLSAAKAPLVYVRLVKRLRALKLGDFADYVRLVQTAGADDERRQMISALTTNVTRFFREPHHFDHLRIQVLDRVLAEARHGNRMRLWSSACSTGQEPYSIAAVLAGLLPEASTLDIKILATDIDSTVLDHAKAGRYESIDGVPSDLRRWFRQEGAAWQVDDALRGLVSFRHLNLNAAWPMRGPFDAVFCRNVAIYFDHDVQAKLWASFADVMRPGSHLYIGHSERIGGPAAERFDNVGVTTYRRRSGR